MHQITSDLYVSDCADVIQLTDSTHEFDEIVTLGYHEELLDGPPPASTTGDQFVITNTHPDFSKFERAVGFVADQIDTGETVLVHCETGQSRGPAVCTGALATVNDCHVSDALMEVREARPSIALRESLRNALEQYTGESLMEKPVLR